MQNIQQELFRYSQLFNIHLTATNLTGQVSELVRKIAEQGKPVVFLVDEYDKPIIDYLTQKQEADKNRKTLKDFFSPLKGLEGKGHLQFLFVTGFPNFLKSLFFQI